MKIAWQNGFALGPAEPSDLLIAKESGFKFDSASASWIGDAGAVKQLRSNSLRLSSVLTITELAVQHYKAAGQIVLDAVEQSRAEDSDLIIPAPPGHEYLPFQKAGIAYALKRRDTLIGDDPGLGKTIQGIGFVNGLDTARKILIVCPAFLKPMWRDKFQEWDVKGLSVGIAEGVKDNILPATDVVVMNYEILKAYRDDLRLHTWHVMIVDEIHKCKNGKSGRTREIFGGIKRAKDKTIIERVEPVQAARCIFLTGTPSLNGKPKELWPLVQRLDPNGLGSDWFSYAKQYCGLQEIKRFNPQTQQREHIGWIWDGATNLEDLQQKMRSRFMVRRLKGAVLKELPPKRRMIIPISVTPGKAKKLLKEIQEFEKYTGGAEDAYFEMPQFGSFSTRMLETGLEMVESTIEVAKNDLEDMDKIVIMCYHLEVSRAIAAAFDPNEVILISGDLAPEKRYDAAKQFQIDPKLRVSVGTIDACSEGLDLFAAYEMIFPERSWKPGAVTQAEDRIHRRGQLEQCLYKHLVLEGSLLERQVKALIVKQEKADAMLDKQ